MARVGAAAQLARYDAGEEDECIGTEQSVRVVSLEYFGLADRTGEGRGREHVPAKISEGRRKGTCAISSEDSAANAQEANIVWNHASISTKLSGIGTLLIEKRVSPRAKRCSTALFLLVVVK